MRRRAIGIIRVSQVGNREGDSFVSPTVQLERIRKEAARQDLDLVAVHEELDVSGGADLTRRPGLGPALQAIENREAEVLIAAYFDRFFRSMTVQAQVIARVENAGGQVLAVDFGLVSHTTAAQWLSASVSGMMAEYYRRAATERNAESLQRAITRGAPPWPRVTTGYRRRDDKTYEPHPDLAPVVRQAFELRARHATVSEVREHLQAAGVTITYPGTVKLLASRVVLGEIHFGEFTPNLNAHEPIVDRTTWEAVQRARVPSGRKSKSPRLLARLGVLRCGTCDHLLLANTAHSKGYTTGIYRCQNHDCDRRVTVSANRVETEVVDAVKGRLDVAGTASHEDAAVHATHVLERAQAELDTAIRTLSIVGDEPATIQRLGELKSVRDSAQADADRLSGLASALRIDASDWDRFTFDERRSLITDIVGCVLVMPGRAPDRVRFRFVE